MTDYLTMAEVLAMHVDQIQRYGGGHGARDPGLLESALFRPQTGYYADLIEEAQPFGKARPKTTRSSTATNALPLPPLIPFSQSTAHGLPPTPENAGFRACALRDEPVHFR
jgi:hypothetical protein